MRFLIYFKYSPYLKYAFCNGSIVINHAPNSMRTELPQPKHVVAETEIAENSREILLDSPKCTPFSVSGCGRRGCALARKTQTRADAQCHGSSSSRVIWNNRTLQRNIRSGVMRPAFLQCTRNLRFLPKGKGMGERVTLCLAWKPGVYRGNIDLKGLPLHGIEWWWW